MSFDHGIDNIVYAGRDEPAIRDLPERRNLEPSGDGVRAHLAELLEEPNTTQFLAESLRPDIGSRDLLMPSRFAEALKQALSELTELAESRPGESRPLNRAARLIKEEANLRELVAMYRSALQQG